MAQLPPVALLLPGTLFIIAVFLLAWLRNRVSWRRTVVPVIVAGPLAYFAICALGLQSLPMLLATIANALGLLILLLIVEAVLARFSVPGP